MSALWIEPFGGIAGDMLLGAFLDLEDVRFTIDDVRRLARELVGGEGSVEVEKVWRGSLSGRCVTVRTHETEHPPHRGLADCLALIERSSLARGSKARAAAVFRRIAEAEARVHGAKVEEIHFHEVGAVDALIDVCANVLALERLGIESVFASPPLLGSGTVRCLHGEMPVPAPGTAEILRGHASELGGGPGERTTPTGAALLVEFASPFRAPHDFTALEIGYGAGHKDFASGPPNILRVTLGRARADRAATEVWQLEVNLDDQSAEEIGFLVEQLRAVGALEVWTSSIHMKKDRPGTLVSALARAELRQPLEEALFAHSTTLGCRWRAVQRTELAREELEVTLDGHRVRVKRRVREDVEAIDLSPEYDDLAALARASGRNLRELEREVVLAALRLLGVQL
ncbi:MAG: nickel pincer cofactor biosynthesis protein LarC [Planctomycetes bacterium]|nr:nickel pincer cofactor biosynthesis protein LarC [Planctomycetota bacterium]